MKTQVKSLLRKLMINAKSVLILAVTFGWIAIVMSLLFNILTGSTRLGLPATDTEVLLQTNAQLIDMVRWTISTILLVGGGLIGLNWYQNERRIKNDLESFEEQIRDLDRRAAEANISQLESVKFATERIMETEKSLFLLKHDLQQSTLSLYGYGPEKSLGETLVEMLDMNPTYPNFVIEQVRSFTDFVASQDHALPFSRYLASDHLEPIAVHMDKANRTDLAVRLRETAKSIRRYDPPTQVGERK